MHRRKAWGYRHGWREGEGGRVGRGTQGSVFMVPGS